METQKNAAACIGVEAAGGPSQSCACERPLILDKNLDLTCFSTLLCNQQIKSSKQDTWFIRQESTLGPQLGQRSLWGTPPKENPVFEGKRGLS